jgi:hypothetical protein
LVPLSFAERYVLNAIYPVVFGVLGFGSWLGGLITPETQPGDSVRTSRVLTKEMTDNVVNACRDQGISVTSALHAALIRATQVSQGFWSFHVPLHLSCQVAKRLFYLKRIQLSAGKHGSTYAQMSTVDLRRFLPEAYKANAGYSIGSLATALPVAANLVDGEKTFVGLARALHGGVLGAP